ncbi:hypothetical protein HanXRQr2_Chr08g0349521 [Helianthus annuus]|uniref:Uncharacterized protein n=1 Tax=Helianthus annuus TaxID=4232 RepID=A0A9K3IH86_HELAN|nr:hypothetical protein HanXRQr2_Chr08g0349521 [Helianthus annuus]
MVSVRSLRVVCAIWNFGTEISHCKLRATTRSLRFGNNVWAEFLKRSLRVEL